MDLGSARDELYSRGTVTAAKAVLASSEQELTHLDNQLLLLIAALARMFLANPPEAEAPAIEPPINVFLEGDTTGTGGGEEGAEDDEVARSLQGSHFAVCKNGRRDVGLNNPTEIDDEPDRDAAPLIPAVEPVPLASTDSNPTASGGGAGGGLDEA